MNAHRIDVFNGTDNNCIVCFVAHDLHFKFFPTQQTFIDQNLVYGRSIHSSATEMFIIITVIGHAPACSSKRKGGTDDGWKANFRKRLKRHSDPFGKISRSVCKFGRSNDGRLRVFQTDAFHRFTEQFAVFSHFDGIAFGADHLNTEFFQDAHFLKRQRGVETRLPPHRRQKRIRAFFFDDFGNNLWRDGFDIGGISKFRIRHDRGRIGVYQNNPIPFFAERLTGLSTRVIKFAGLTNDNWSCADDHYRGDVGSLGHQKTFAISAPARRWGSDYAQIPCLIVKPWKGARGERPQSTHQRRKL